jgi:putative transposase
MPAVVAAQCLSRRLQALPVASIASEEWLPELLDTHCRPPGVNMLRKREPHSKAARIGETKISKTPTDQRTQAPGIKRTPESMQSLRPAEQAGRHRDADVLGYLKVPTNTLSKRSFIGFDQKIAAMYARGMTERAIYEYLSSMYGPEVSPGHINEVMDEVTREVTIWQGRPLAPMYPLIFLDVLRVTVCEAATIHHKSVCLAWGTLPDGTREVLGIWIAQSKGVTLWPQVLSELRARGISDILIAVIDGLQGALEAQALSEGINTHFPNTMVQTEIVQLIRDSLEQASYHDRKAVAEALRSIYTAQTIKAAGDALKAFAKGAWGVRYPTIVQRWQQTWQNITPFLRLPPEVRQLIYATAAIQNLRARVRRVIKTRGHFVGNDAVRTQLWLTLRNSTTHRVRSTSEWKGATNQFVALYGDRFIHPS